MLTIPGWNASFIWPVRAPGCRPGPGAGVGLRLGPLSPMASERVHWRVADGRSLGNRLCSVSAGLTLIEK